ncbi:MAG: serine/threonine protein kinase [Deltaproteobacteria bacterium]|nr:serine/threonine protein kinase [Deltaproteobacteria bacterium]
MISRFGNYEIVYELKSGGMGSVLLGRRRGPGAFEQLVAIKTIRPEYANAPSVRAMFLDEAAILARLNHPGIAHVHDFGEDGGTLYMVMEYVAGIAFRDLERLPPLIVARAIAEAARGLHAAHEARDLAGTPLGLVHRDISPDNLMVGYDGHVKVIDFGIALIKNRQAPVTEFGTVKGKPPYMSPEQVKNEPMDRRSDVFSLAVVAWEMLTGKHLFEGDSIYSVALAVEQQPLVPPSRALGEELPLGLDAAIMNALDRSLATRTPTAAAFADSLEQVVTTHAGESLAAWTDRTLAEQRESHRAWLASVVAGTTPLPKAIGRSTAQVTQVAPLAPGSTPVQAAAPVVQTKAPTLDEAVAEERSPGTSIGGTGSLALPRSRAPWIALVLLLLLAGGGVAVYLATRSHGVAVEHDAALPDARLAIDAARPDATGDAASDAPADAVVRVDAAPRDAAVVADAGHHAVAPKPDAAVLPIDAAVVAPPAGSGFVSIKFKGDKYTNTTIDGQQIPVPAFHQKIGAGKHTVVFSDPATGQELDRQTFTVADGQSVTITQR